MIPTDLVCVQMGPVGRAGLLSKTMKMVRGPDMMSYSFGREEAGSDSRPWNDKRSAPTLTSHILP